jgi:tetratricopeptide (TPR) repeat protein
MKKWMASSMSVLIAGVFSSAVRAQHAPEQEQLGNVRFPVSCSAEAQQRFHRAMALYHSFAWTRVRPAFTEITQVDVQCGMAWWGLAMVAADNPFGWPQSVRLKEGEEAIQKAQEVGASTPRERDYIAALALLYKDHATVPHRQRALAYEQAMAQLAARYPDDVEAQILHALIVSGNHDLNDKTYARPLRAASLLEPLFASHPHHPGVAHYLIHSYDYPPIAHKGLEAAQRYAQTAADAGHAQHMPSHIFTRVGSWRESVASNQKSIEVAKGDHRYIPHAWDYMVYAYLQLADDANAEKIAAEARALRTLSYTYSAGVYGLAALQARLALERGRWAEAAQLELPAAPAPDDWKRFPQAESVHVFARALGAARSGDATGARREIERLRTLHAALNEKKLAYWAEQTDIQVAIATAWALRAEGKDAEALATLRAAAEREEGTEKHVSMPGYLLPARELLGDLLLELGRPTEALREYEASIAKEPNRFRGLYGAARAAERAGERDKAKTYYTKLTTLAEHAKHERAELQTARAFLGK